MKKIEELKKVLNFYVQSNVLKTKIYDEENNYTISDCLYGAITLAIAMDSEFKETENVSKIIKMMILDEFNRNNPSYNLEKELKKGNQLQGLVEEARIMQTKESKLAFKYRMMDFVLTNLIKTRMDLTQAELIEEGIKCFNPKNDEEYNKYREVVKYYILNSRLKDKNRSGWDNEHWNVKSDRIERIAEHIVSTILLAIAMESEFDYNEELDFDRNIEIDQIVKMLSIHEIGETLIGDITPFDGITPEQKREMEFRAVKDALGNLQDNEELFDIFQDFETKFSNEARFAYFCDKLEADLQSKFYQDNNQHRTLDDQENNTVMKLDKVKNMIKKGAKTPFDIWYEYDKKIYEGNRFFPQFYELLTLIRDNDILKLGNNLIVEKVKLSKNQYEFLTKEISDMLQTIKDDMDVDGVIEINSFSETHKKGTIIIEFVLNDRAFYKKYKRLTELLTTQFAKINKTPINVKFNYHYTTDYQIPALNPSDVYREERLYDAKILMDRTGKLTKIQNRREINGHFYPFYTIEYIPPIDEKISMTLKK